MIEEKLIVFALLLGIFGVAVMFGRSRDEAILLLAKLRNHEQEIARLKRGDFTEEEYANLVEIAANDEKRLAAAAGALKMEKP